MNNVIQNKPRMILLYRTSLKKQTEKTQDAYGNIENDIPLQRRILRPWADNIGMFVREFVEGGVSGYKVSAAKRDALQYIKEMADRREFDVLGIYMSERLGRIADETPLIVSYLNARGIKVMSFTEGEISTRTHVDKLITYVRYWQAEGESLKTSIRIKDTQKDSVTEGRWRGGCLPYGYRHISRGTLNPKGKPILDIDIYPEEAEVIKTIFRLYGKEHYSSGAIAKYLNDTGVPTKTGIEWPATMILKLLKNKLYIGIYELHKHSPNQEKIYSPIMDNMVIMPRDEWDEVEVKLKENGVKNKKPPTRGGGLLLSGLLFCGECGLKYTSSHWTAKRTRMDGSIWEYATDRYRCISYTKPKERIEKCHKTLYRVNEVDNAVLEETKLFLATLNREKLLDDYDAGLRVELKEITVQHKKTTNEIIQKENDLQKLKDEVLKTLIGESKFSQSILSDLIQQREKELVELEKRRDMADKAAIDIDNKIRLRKTVQDEYRGWDERFDILTIQEKRAMLINIIERITIYPNRVQIIFKVRINLLESAVSSGYNGRSLLHHRYFPILTTCIIKRA